MRQTRKKLPQAYFAQPTQDLETLTVLTIVRPACGNTAAATSIDELHLRLSSCLCRKTAALHRFLGRPTTPRESGASLHPSFSLRSWICLRCARALVCAFLPVLSLSQLGRRDFDSQGEVHLSPFQALSSSLVISHQPTPFSSNDLPPRLARCVLSSSPPRLARSAHSNSPDNPHPPPTPNSTQP